MRTADAVTEHCRAAIVAAGPASVAVKLQLACFERLGALGWEALERVIAVARDHGLLVMADGKRGDVPVTARAYAQALVGRTPGPFGDVEGLGVDAFTANPLLGRDALEPLIEAAAQAGAGCFVLVRTSNPGAAELQDEVEPPLHERLARMVHELGSAHLARSGLSAVGAVTGATSPEHLGASARAHARRRVPAAGGGRPGRPGRGSRPRLRGPSGGRARGRIPLDRRRATRERGGDPAAAAQRPQRIFGRPRGTCRGRARVPPILRDACPDDRCPISHDDDAAARLIAPLALVAVAAALASVVINSNVVERGRGDGGERTSERTSTGRTEQNDRPRQRTRARYTIKTGDTLGGIAEKTGVSVERLWC